MNIQKLKSKYLNAIKEFQNKEQELLIPLEHPFQLEKHKTANKPITTIEDNSISSDLELDSDTDNQEKYVLNSSNTNFNIEIPLTPGSIYGLVGRNGIGKTTLLKKIKRNTKGVSFLRQEIKITNKKVTDIIKGYNNKYLQGFKEVNAEQKVNVENKLMNEMSGGWIRRVFIERVMNSNSKLILLDEPTNMLDLYSITKLENDIKRQKDKIFIIVSHDIEFLNSVTSHILLLTDKLELFKGNYDSFEQQHRINVENKRREYKNQIEERKNLQKFVDKFRYNASKAAQAQSKLKILKKLPKLEEIVELADYEFKFYGSQMQGIIELQNIRIDPKSRAILVGENGSGKSTFLKSIIDSPLVANVNVGYLPQIYKFGEITVQQFLTSKGTTHDEAFKFARNFGLARDFQFTKDLSGGEKIRLLLASISIKRPALLLLDEPTNHLDIESIKALKKVIKDFQGAVICVSHDLRFIDGIFDEIYEVKDKHIKIYKGSIRDYKKRLLSKN